MKLSTLAAILFLLPVLGRQASQQPPKAIIEGTVLRTGGNETIEGARVVVARVPAAPLTLAIPSVATDNQGKFLLKDLDVGSYRLTVIANGYARQEYGQRIPGMQGTVINLVAGQTMKDIVVRSQVTAMDI